MPYLYYRNIHRTVSRSDEDTYEIGYSVQSSWNFERSIRTHWVQQLHRPICPILFCGHSNDCRSVTEDGCHSNNHDHIRIWTNLWRVHSYGHFIIIVWPHWKTWTQPGFEPGSYRIGSVIGILQVEARVVSNSRVWAFRTVKGDRDFWEPTLRAGMPSYGLLMVQ